LIKKKKQSNRKGFADLVAGVSYVSNPDLVERFENNLDLEWDLKFLRRRQKGIQIIQKLLNK
jgi:hypothetical protein